MPASERSLAITDAYRTRLALLQQRAAEQAGGRWAEVNVEDLDGSHAAWLAGTAVMLGLFQRTGVTLTLAYLSAFIASELNRAPAPPAGPRATVGVTDDGRPVATALLSSLIAVEAALKDGQAPSTALEAGKTRATRMAADAAISAPRAELDAQVLAIDEIAGWRRVTFGGCGACLAAATGAIQHERETLKVHPHCRCAKEPVVRNVTETALRPTGPEVFAAMSRAGQDQALGPVAAQAIREGRVAWADLIGTSSMADRPDMLTQAPLGAAA